MSVQFNFFDGAGKRKHPVLEGFHYRPELIDEAGENALLTRLRELPFREFEFHGSLHRRHSTTDAAPRRACRMAGNFCPTLHQQT